jgi:hypothetical protein
MMVTFYIIIKLAGDILHHYKTGRQGTFYIIIKLAGRQHFQSFDHVIYSYGYSLVERNCAHELVDAQGLVTIFFFFYLVL